MNTSMKSIKAVWKILPETKNDTEIRDDVLILTAYCR